MYIERSLIHSFEEYGSNISPGRTEPPRVWNRSDFTRKRTAGKSPEPESTCELFIRSTAAFAVSRVQTCTIIVPVFADAAVPGIRKAQSLRLCVHPTHCDAKTRSFVDKIVGCTRVLT